MTFEEFLQSKELALLGKIMLDESKKETRRRYADLNRIAKTGQTVFVGDSIVEKFPISEMLGYDIYNRGISGYTTAETLEMLNDTALPLKPKKVFVLAGTNDLQEEISLDETADNMRRITETFLKTGTKIYVVSVLPVNVLSDEENVKRTVGRRNNKSICMLNEKYRSVCNEVGVSFLNVYDLLCENDNLPEKYSFDGLHPNIEGYMPVAEELKKYL